MLEFVLRRLPRLGRRNLPANSAGDEQMCNLFRLATVVMAIALSSSGTISRAQMPVAPSPGPSRDKRFVNVTEDWTSPTLATSHLGPVSPLTAYLDDSHASYTVQLLQLQWRGEDPIDLYVLKPKGVKTPPVILNLYGYPEDTDPYKNEVFQEALTRDGFAAVGFVSALTGHRYHDRPMKEWFLSELQESLATSAHDVQMILDYLATRNDLDMTRVGMFGQGSGASIAILASAADSRIKVLDVLDPWGDWPVWLAQSPFVPEEERAVYLKPDFLHKVAGLDPLDWLTRIKAGKFRLQQLLFETDTPDPAKEKLRAGVPKGTPVVLYKNLDDFKAAFPASTNLEWMKHELRLLAPGAENSKITTP
jgi:hypothetical protein